MDMNRELQKRQEIDNKLNESISDRGGLFEELEKLDKIICLDFSYSMTDCFDGKQLYQHLVDAVRGYEREYPMIVFRSSAEITTCLEKERPDGGTNLTNALRIAYNKGAEEYIVVSDGLPCDCDEALRYAVDNKMRISTIFIGDNADGKYFMARLSSMTGGKSNDIRLLEGFSGVLEKTIKGLIEG